MGAAALLNAATIIFSVVESLQAPAR